MTRAAEEGKLDPVVGREREIERLAQILSRRKKNNPVLIGEPGVGKSAIVEGLALRIVQKKVSRILFEKRVVMLDMASVVAGTKYRGQFEERIRSIINELQKNPNVILFIDEIHTIVGAGAAAGAGTSSSASSGAAGALGAFAPSTTSAVSGQRESQVFVSFAPRTSSMVRQPSRFSNPESTRSSKIAGSSKFAGSIVMPPSALQHNTAGS